MSLIIPQCCICAKPFQIGAAGWVNIHDTARVGRPARGQVARQFPLAFCSDCAAKTTVDKLPALRKAAKGA